MIFFMDTKNFKLLTGLMKKIILATEFCEVPTVILFKTMNRGTAVSFQVQPMDLQRTVIYTPAPQTVDFSSPGMRGRGAARPQFSLFHQRAVRGTPFQSIHPPPPRPPVSVLRAPVVTARRSRRATTAHARARV